MIFCRRKNSISEIFWIDQSPGRQKLSAKMVFYILKIFISASGTLLSAVILLFLKVLLTKHSDMKQHSPALVLMATVCCIVACVGDFALTGIIGYFYKDYNFLTQSESYLGTSDSPVAIYMNAWGVVFSLLFIMYAFALRQTIFKVGLWQHIAVWLIVIYGVGEGAGSGLFPYNHVGNALTLSGILHSVFSAIGDIAMVILPFVLLKVFPKRIFPKMHYYTLFVGITATTLIIIFLLARQHIVPLKGLWQRLFLLDYYLMLMVIAIDMLITNLKNRKRNTA
jgi:hypothetical protein